MATYHGTSGDDALTGTSSADIFNLGQGGNDTAHGGSGDDVFYMGGSLTAADKIDGGADTDKVVLNGDYSSGLIFATDTLSGIEIFRLVGNFDYSLTMNDGNVAAGERLTVNAGPVGGTHYLNFDGSAESDGHFTIYGSGGSDTIVGGTQSDLIYLGQGGNDSADGGGGNDRINAGSALTAVDHINGGGGNDVVILNGNYAGGLVFGASTMVNVEYLKLLGGHDYNLTIDDATVGTGGHLTVYGNLLGASDVLTFDGSAESDGHLRLVGGAGDDVLTGGQLDNVFVLSLGGNDSAQGGSGTNTFDIGAALNAADAIDGGSSLNDTVVLNGDYTGAHALVFSATTMLNVEMLNLDGGHSYDLTVNDATAGSAGSYLMVDGSALGSSDTLTFNATAETDAFLLVTGGAGNDVITSHAAYDLFYLQSGGNDTAITGAGIDEFVMGASMTAADNLDGGGDNDIVLLDGDYTGANALTFSATTMINVEFIGLSTQSGSGFSYDLTTNNATVGQYLYVDATSLASTDTLKFNGSAETSGQMTFYFGANFTAADSITGGAAHDWMTLGGDYSAGLTFAAATIQSIETISLGAGYSYNLTTNDANVGNGKVLSILGLGLGASDVITFDGSAETNGKFDLIAGAGDDVLTGGAQADGFMLSEGGDDTAHGGGGNDDFSMGDALTASDAIDGGAGSDTLDLEGDYSGSHAVVFSATTLINVETILLQSIAFNTLYHFDLTTNDATVANGQVLTVDESLVIPGTTLTFDGSAETDGSFNFIGGVDVDMLTGGANGDTFAIGDDVSHSVQGNDTVTGGGGGDTIHASSNAADQDTFVYDAVSDSTSAGYDKIANLNFATDIFDTGNIAATPGAIDAAVSGGTLSTISFDVDLAAAVGSAQLGAHDAVLFTAGSGSLSGHTFLIVDINGAAGYQAGADLVMDVTGFSGALTTGNFI